MMGGRASLCEEDEELTGCFSSSTALILSSCWNYPAVCNSFLVQWSNILLETKHTSSAAVSVPYQAAWMHTHWLNMEDEYLWCDMYGLLLHQFLSVKKAVIMCLHQSQRDKNLLFGDLNAFTYSHEVTFQDNVYFKHHKAHCLLSELQWTNLESFVYLTFQSLYILSVLLDVNLQKE